MNNASRLAEQTVTEWRGQFLKMSSLTFGTRTWVPQQVWCVCVSAYASQVCVCVYRTVQITAEAGFKTGGLIVHHKNRTFWDEEALNMSSHQLFSHQHLTFTNFCSILRWRILGKYKSFIISHGHVGKVMLQSIKKVMLTKRQMIFTVKTLDSQLFTYEQQSFKSPVIKKH